MLLVPLLLTTPTPCSCYTHRSSFPAEIPFASHICQPNALIKHKRWGYVQLQPRYLYISAEKVAHQQRRGSGIVHNITYLNDIWCERLKVFLECVLRAIRVLFQPILHAEVPIHVSANNRHISSSPLTYLSTPSQQWQ